MSERVNAAAEAEELAVKLGERIESVVIAAKTRVGDAAPGRMMTWEVGRRELDIDYDDDYGAVDAFPPFYAYTRSWVIFIKDYDRRPIFHAVPRNPVDGVVVGFK